ncbi:MAG: beta strand repeat-containing protein, partial [Roseimicrobium sp.]
GDLELRINSASIPFNSGVALATNWNSAATIASGIFSDDNLCQPYANASGNLFVSVLDNSNNNAVGANPSTSEQTSGVSVAFLPYSGGWTGASVNASGAVTSGNLPTGVSIVKTGTGTYAVDGLSTQGNLLAFTNGDSGTLADNVCSVRIVAGRWLVDTRDNANGAQDNDFSFAYFPPNSTGVYAGQVTGSGTVSSTNASASSLGVTASASASGLTLTFGDGAVINPSTAALFVVGDSSNGESTSTAVDNLISWSASGNSFKIFTQDLEGVNGTHEAIDLRFVAIPLVVQPTVATGTVGEVSGVAATLTGNDVSNSGGLTITERGVVFATAANPTLADAKATVSGTVGTFDAALSGLLPGTTYYARAFATNGLGTTYGAEVSFATPSIATTGNLSARSDIYGTPSAADSFSVSGLNLSGNLTVTAPEGFEVSLAEGTGFDTTATLTASGTLPATQVFVRLAASTNPGTYTGVVTVSGSNAPTQEVAVPTSTVATKELSLAGAAVTTKTYDGTTVATITGTLTGVIAADEVSFTGAGEFASANAAEAIPVTPALLLTGLHAAKYTIAQPIGLVGRIEKASQVITFVLSDVSGYGTSQTLVATATSGLPVSFTNLSPTKASLNGDSATFTALGSASFRASQAGNTNYLAASDVEQTTEISPKALTIEGVSVALKGFDGTTGATITGTLAGVVPG